MKKYFLLTAILLIAFSGCSIYERITDRVWVHHSLGLGGPDTWAIKDNDGNSIGYYNGNCCCIASKVVDVLADQINDGYVPRIIMVDKSMQDRKLKFLCDSLKALEK